MKERWKFHCELIAGVCSQNSSLQRRPLSQYKKKGRRQEPLVMLQAHANQPQRQTLCFKKKEGKNSERVRGGSRLPVYDLSFSKVSSQSHHN